MPGFVGHTTANVLAVVATSAYMVSEHWSIPDVIAVDAGILISTLVLSPDMDLFASKPIGSWGIVRYVWWPYAKLVKHRDRLHVPLIGTIARWLYVIVLAALAILPFAVLMRRIGFGITFTGDVDDIIYYLLYLVDIFVGANIADAIHFCLDVFTHGLKHTTAPRRDRRAIAHERGLSPGGDQQ